MKCTECRSYSRGLRRCLKGKANPPTLKGAMDVAKWGNLCLQSKWLEQVLANLKKEN